MLTIAGGIVLGFLSICIVCMLFDWLIATPGNEWKGLVVLVGLGLYGAHVLGFFF